MATRATLRTALRQRLEDTSGSPLWSDGDLHEALTEAVRQYGVRLPSASTATVSIVAGTSDYALPAGVTAGGIVQVLDGNGATIERDTMRGGSPGPADATGWQQAWSAWGSRLYLAVEPATAEMWTLRYLGGRELVADDVSEQPVDAGDEPIVIELAAAWAYQRRGVEDAKRGNVDRFSRLEKRSMERADELIAARFRRARGSVMA
jgi:hypothetical protein